MESVQVELPSDLLQQVRQEISSDAALSEVVTEAIQMWLEKRLSEKSKREGVLDTLRKSGLVMTLEKQQALADAMISPLHLGEMPNREELESVLGRLKVPLSEEIIVMRGQG
jgi:Arc/MetJ-type ribon-helix-helix transcriptional regulator